MYEYLVVLEADDGSFFSEPEMFDTKQEARTYADAHPSPDRCEWVFYECRRIIINHDLTTGSGGG